MTGSTEDSYSRDYRTSISSVRVLRAQVKWGDLYFYKKTVVLDQQTFVFCQRFLPKYGDRSTEMELKLLNVARASLKELKEDYPDCLRRHELAGMKGGVR